MNQLLLEKSLEKKLIPNTSKRNSMKKLYDDPNKLAKKFAEETIGKVFFNK
ncbi:hypothetical protein [Neobacillus sp. FSL H8-0543]|uniref:hypothetical protein n=1 Tax=Neobacillus sp. FSL H8-0543 TaxID=2954672 RepID=UPI003159883E